jgi:hypothetical protein
MEKITLFSPQQKRQDSNLDGSFLIDETMS